MSKEQWSNTDRRKPKR